MKLQEWQAILIAYGVLLLGAETSLAPLAGLMAWGIAIAYFLDVNLTQGDLLSNLFPVGGATPAAPLPPGGLAAPPASPQNRPTIASG